MSSSLGVPSGFLLWNNKPRSAFKDSTRPPAPPKVPDRPGNVSGSWFENRAARFACTSRRFEILGRTVPQRSDLVPAFCYAGVT